MFLRLLVYVGHISLLLLFLMEDVININLNLCFQAFTASRIFVVIFFWAIMPAKHLENDYS